MPEQDHTTNQHGRKPLKKKRIVRMSTPLPSVRPPTHIEDKETSRLPANIAAVRDDDEALKESIAAQQTHHMPVPARINETSQEVFAEQANTVMPAPPAHSFLPGRWKLSHILLILVVLAPFIIGGGVLEAAQLNQNRNGLYQIEALTGATQWQQTPATSTQIAYADARGSLLNVTTSTGQHQIVALNSNGITLWKSFQSQNTLTPLATVSPAGTLLLALSGHISASNPVTGVTATYLHPFTLSLLERQSGQVLWQNTLISPQQAQGAKIVGADSHYLYVALAQTRLQSYKAKRGVELVAIDPHDGHVAWHITDPAQANAIPQDAGQLLLYKNLAVWQVAGTLYTIDTTSTGQGKILWRAFIAETHTQMLLQEEAQMAVAGGDLLFERSDAFHALDIQSGAVQWEISNPNLDSGNTLAVTAITSYGTTVILYESTDIEAINTLTQHIVWSLKQLDAIHNLRISNDGTLAFVTTTDSIEGSAPTQALVALDMSNGTVRWTFQPSDQINFIPLATGGIAYSQNIILTTFCLSQLPVPCTQQYLYALNPSTGTTLWKYAGNTFSDVYLSSDGRIVLFQRNSNAWLDLTERFKNS